MSETTPTLEKQIGNIIEERMTTFHKENKKIIEDTIRVVVNGKIDRMNSKLEAYILEDTKWKETATPVVKAYEDTDAFRRVGAIILKGLILIGAAISAYLIIRKNLL